MEMNEEKQKQLLEQYHIPEDYDDSNNGQYEYMVKYIFDNEQGYAYSDLLEMMLNYYANDGWHLHNIHTNQLGQKVSDSTNTTLCVTVVIFERENI